MSGDEIERRGLQSIFTDKAKPVSIDTNYKKKSQERQARKEARKKKIQDRLAKNTASSPRLSGEMWPNRITIPPSKLEEMTQKSFLALIDEFDRQKVVLSINQHDYVKSFIRKTIEQSLFNSLEDQDLKRIEVGQEEQPDVATD